MGEYADMMLEGDACAGCGDIFHDDEAAGFPRYCAGCEPDVAPARVKAVRCPACNRRFHDDFAAAQHRLAKGH